MSWTSALVGAGYLAASIAAASFASIRFASQFSADRLERAFLATLFGLADGVFVPLVTLMLGVVGRLSVLVGHIVIAGAVAILLPRRDPIPRSDGKPVWTTTATAALFAAFVALSTLTSLAGPTRDTDTRGYHAGILISWLRHRSFWSLPLIPARGAFQGGYPSNTETLGLSLTLPTHRDALTLVVPVLFAILAILAIAVLARELGAPAWLGMMAGVAVFATPTIYWTQTRSLHTDAAAAAGFVAAVALVTKAWKDERPVWLIAAGAGLGLAVGSRYALLIPGIAVVLFAGILLRSVRRILWMLPGLVVFALPWFIRNAVATGDPFFPQTIHLAGTTLFAGSNNPLLNVEWSIASRILRVDTNLTRIWVNGLLWWLGPALLIIVAGAVVGWRRGASKGLRVGSALVIVAFAAYTITPLTGAGASNTIFNLRYLLPTLAVGAALTVATRRRAVAFVLVGATLIYDIFRIVAGSRTATVKGLDVTATLAAGAILVAVAVAIGLRLDLGRAAQFLRGGRLGLTLVASVAILWLALGGFARWSDSRYQPTRLEMLVAKALGKSHGTVSAIGVRDMRSLYGKRLDTRLTTPSLSDPQPDAQLLDSMLLATLPRVVVVDDVLTYGVPANYVPPAQWCRIGDAGPDSVWIRRPARSRGQTCS